ncbi:Tumor protein p73 [Exaiptasia diaphana]|nr:Tumor protein p73 [Exaiptasia diaphana]
MVDYDNYGFQVTYSNETFGNSFAANNCKHTYSKLLDVVFIRRLCLCPFTIKTKTMPPQGSYVRAVCFLRNSAVPIQRCSRHMAHEFQQENEVDKVSFMRCHNPSAVYEITPEGHISIVFPVGYFINEDSLLSGKIENFEFKCANNCISNKQKTPLAFVFTIEKDYAVLGRQTLNINICASPGRDMKNWERTSVLRAQPIQALSLSNQQIRKRKPEDDEDAEHSTSSELTPKQSIESRVKEGLEALEVVPKQVIEYYKQLSLEVMFKGRQ